MSGHRRLLLRIAILAACVAAVAWIVSRLGWRRLIDVAADADPWWLALAFLPILGRFLIWAFKWSLMTRAHLRVPFGFALGAVLAGAFVNLTTPTAKLAGGFLRAVLLNRRSGCGMATAYGWALADQATNLLGNVALIGALTVTAALIGIAGDVGPRFLVSGLAALALVAAGLVLRKRIWRAVDSRSAEGWWSRLVPERLRSSDMTESGRSAFQRALEPLLSLRATPAATAVDLALAAAAFGALCLSNALVLRALGAEAPLVLVSTCVALGYLAGTLSGTMGGAGATELVLIELYALIGIPRDAATAGALLHRAGFYLLVAAGGGLSLWLLTRRRS